MIFPYIECDEVVQADDKLRISSSKSFASKDEAAISLVEIEPEAGNGFIDVTGATPLRADNFYLDWQYATDGSKVISARVTTDGAPTTITKTITVITAAEDNLFSSDQDLAAVENNILKYVPAGKNSFKYLHREAQKQILEWFYINGYRATDGSRLEKEDVIVTEELKYWSTYTALRLLFEDLSNAIDDIFDKKSKLYQVQEHRWRHNSLLKIDVNKDGVQGDNEGFLLTTRNLIRE